MVRKTKDRGAWSAILAQLGSNHYGNRVTDLQGTDSHAKRPSGSAKCGGLDTGFEDSKRHSRSSPHFAAVEAFNNQMAFSGEGPYLFSSDLNPTGPLKKLKTVWTRTLRRAKIPYFRIYDLRSAYATRLSAGGLADEWVTQLLRQSDAQVIKKYSRMKLRIKREALEKLNRRANEMAPVGDADAFAAAPSCTEVLQ